MFREILPVIVFIAFVSGATAGLSIWLNSEGGQVLDNGENHLNNEENALDVSILCFTTDKGGYSSNSQMELTMTLNVSEPWENAKVRLWGLKDPAGGYWIEEDRWENLSSGMNELVFDFQMPSCNSCAGYGEGSYDIYGEVLLNSQVVDAENTSVYLH